MKHLAWIGPLVTFGGAVSYFTWAVRYPALRDVPWLNLPLVLAGLGLSIAGVRGTFSRPAGWLARILGGAGLAVALAVSGLFAFYVFDFSYRVPPADAALALRRAPDFSLIDHLGRPVRLADHRGKKVVLVFFRGHW